MNPVTPEELFQIIGEQTVTIRKQLQQLTQQQNEIKELRPPVLPAKKEKGPKVKEK